MRFTLFHVLLGLFRKKKIAEKNTVSIASTILWLANSAAADFQSDLLGKEIDDCYAVLMFLRKLRLKLRCLMLSIAAQK